MSLDIFSWATQVDEDDFEQLGPTGVSGSYEHESEDDYDVEDERFSAWQPDAGKHKPVAAHGFSTHDSYKSDSLYYHTKVAGKKITKSAFAFLYRIADKEVWLPFKYCKCAQNDSVFVWTPFLVARFNGMSTSIALSTFERNWADPSYKYHVNNLKVEQFLRYLDRDEELDLTNLKGAGKRTKAHKKDKSWHTKVDEFGGF